MTFQDVGADRVWEIELPDSSYVLYSWSPNGCYMLLRGNRYGIFSLASQSLKLLPAETFPVTNMGGSPSWTLDGEGLVFPVRFNFNDSINVYLYNLEAESTELLQSLDIRDNSGILQLVSSDELLYIHDGYWRVWNMRSRTSRPFGTEQFPRYGTPDNWDFFPYASIRSLNHEILARYFSLLNATVPMDTLYPEDFVIPEDLPQTPGFDLYFLNEGTTRHIDVNGQFLQSLGWSTTSTKLVVSTYSARPPETNEFSGIYVYDVQADMLQKVGDFITYRDIEYGPFVPTLSPDDEWVALPTATDWLLYRLSDGEIIVLDEQFNESPYMEMSWSPVMHYSETQCSE